MDAFQGAERDLIFLATTSTRPADFGGEPERERWGPWAGKKIWLIYRTEGRAIAGSNSFWQGAGQEDYDLKTC